MNRELERSALHARDLQELAVGLPPQLVAAVNGYVEQHASPGSGFLRAVLANDLYEAAGRAMPEHAVLIQPIVRYVFNAVPGNARGSYAAVDAWLAGKP